MSKETEARVRDELLQQLYASTLRCALSATSANQAGSRAGIGDAVAAGLCANLHPRDTLLLPARGAGALRALRGLSYDRPAGATALDRAAGVLPLPAEEAAAVSFAFGVACSQQRHEEKADDTSILVVVLPPAASLAPVHGKAPASPRTWSEFAHVSARAALPVLLLSDPARAARRVSGSPSPHLSPAPLYPSIPVDREDALAVYRVAFECAQRARAGGGPSHLACLRVDADGSALDRLEAMLRKRGAFQKAWRRDLERRLVRELTSS